MIEQISSQNQYNLGLGEQNIKEEDITVIVNNTGNPQNRPPANIDLQINNNEIPVQTRRSCKKAKKIVPWFVVPIVIGVTLLIFFKILLPQQRRYDDQGQVIMNQKTKLTAHLTNPMDMTSTEGQFRSKSLSRPLPLTFTQFHMSHKNGRLLHESEICQQQIDYYHKDTQISMCFDQNLTPTLRIPVDTAINFIVKDLPMTNYEILQETPELLKKKLSKIARSLISSQQATVDWQISYDGVFDNKSQSYNILTEENSYIPEQFQSINQMIELMIVKYPPKISNASDLNQITQAVVETIKQINSNILKIVNQNKAVLLRQFGRLMRTKENVRSEFVRKGCSWIHSNIIRCSKKVWESGDLKISNKDAKNPVQILSLVISAK